MIIDLSLWMIIAITTIAFLCEYMDSTLGMGYGTTMTPLLLLFGFKPMQIVPAVLASELVTGVLAGFLHDRAGNVNLRPKILNIPRIVNSLKTIGWRQSFRKGIPRHLKVAILLVLSSILGASSAVFTAGAISRFWQQFYTGCMVIAMGLIIIACFNREFKFSWIKIGALGSIASFNKGLTGGGYGPLIMSGQLLSGVESKNAIGITSLAEGLTCLVGVLTYILTARDVIDWKLAPFIIAGAVCSIPFSVKSVKRIQASTLKVLIAILTIVLGVFTLIKLFSGVS